MSGFEKKVHWGAAKYLGSFLFQLEKYWKPDRTPQMHTHGRHNVQLYLLTYLC